MSMRLPTKWPIGAGTTLLSPTNARTAFCRTHSSPRNLYMIAYQNRDIANIPTSVDFRTGVASSYASYRDSVTGSSSLNSICLGIVFSKVISTFSMFEFVPEAKARASCMTTTNLSGESGSEEIEKGSTKFN